MYENEEFSEINPHLMSIRCHYDKDTALTGNCELLKVIEISSASDLGDVRKILRNALSQTLDSYKISVHFYLMRDREDISIKQQSGIEAIDEIVEGYNAHYKWNESLNNRLYIAFLHLGAKPLLSEANILKRAVSFMFRSSIESTLQKGCAELSDMVNRFCKESESLAPKILSVKKLEDGRYLSEVASVITRIFFGKQCDVVLEDVDIAAMMSEDAYWSSEDLSIAIKKGEALKYNAVFTMKNIYPLTLDCVENILRIESEASFVEFTKLMPKDVAMRDWQRSHEICKISGAVDMMKIGRMDELMPDDNRQKHCSSQYSMILRADNVAALNIAITKFVTMMQQIGVQVIREDVASYTVLMSQIPGNAHYADRALSNILSNSAMFALPCFRNTGASRGSAWGAPIAILKDIERNLPYYFNFHSAQNTEEHSIFVGAGSDVMHDIANFLAMQSVKNEAKLLRISINDNNDSLNSAADLRCDIGYDAARLNFHEIYAELEEKDFEIFISCLVGEDISSDDDTKTLLHDLVNKAKNDDGRIVFASIAKFADEFLKDENANHKSLNQRLCAFFASDDASSVFCADDSIVKQDFDVCCDFHVAKLIKEYGKIGIAAAFALTLLLLKYCERHEGQRNILIIDSFLTILSNIEMRKSLIDRLSEVSAEKCMMMVLFDDIDDFEDIEESVKLMSLFKNQFFATRRYLTKYQSDRLGLSPKESMTLRAFSKFDRSFMLKKDGKLLLSDIIS